MKKLALILLCVFGCFTLSACAAGAKVSAVNSTTVLPNTEEPKTEEVYEQNNTENLTENETAKLVIYLNDNYDCYNFSRYISYGIENLMLCATENEVNQLNELTTEINTAISSGEDLEQKELEKPTGTIKTVYELDEVLYEIWFRAVN